MNSIFKIKEIENDCLKIKKESNLLTFRLENEDFSDFSEYNFDKSTKRNILMKTKNSNSTRKLKYFDKLSNGDFIILKKMNNEYVLNKIDGIPFIKNNKICISLLDSLIINDVFKIPTCLRLNGQTKNTYLTPYKTKEIENLSLILTQLIKEDFSIIENYPDYFLDNNRQATSSAKGYLEQCLIALFYLFHKKHYKKIKNIKIEGKLEDIQVNYRNNENDFIQVKISDNPTKETTFFKERFEKAIEGLNTTYVQTNNLNISTSKLIYASNTIYQPLKRLSNLVLTGTLLNFLEEPHEIYEPEKKLLSQNYPLLNEFKEKFGILRVDPKYLCDKCEYTNEYNDLIYSLQLENQKMAIFDKLKLDFIYNSTVREGSIGIVEIAYSFLKNSKNCNKFNKLYQDELEELDQDDIEELIYDENLKEIIEYILGTPYVIEEYLVQKKLFKTELKLSNLKKFLDENSKCLNHYKLFNKNIRNELKKELFYKYIFFRLFKNRSLIGDITREFEIEHFEME